MLEIAGKNVNNFEDVFVSYDFNHILINIKMNILWHIVIYKYSLQKGWMINISDHVLRLFGNLFCGQEAVQYVLFLCSCKSHLLSEVKC